MKFIRLLAIAVLWKLFRSSARRQKWFDYLFVVYPGTIEERNITAPSFIGNLATRKAATQLFPVGIITKGKSDTRGLVIALPSPIEEYSEEQLREVVTNLQALAEYLQVNSVGLAGRLPRVLYDAGIAIKPPFTAGLRGTTFTVIKSLRAILKHTSKQPEDIVVGVIGLGYAGLGVFRQLDHFGFKKLVGFEPSRHRENAMRSMIITANPNALSQCDIVIVMSRSGAEIESLLPHLKQGVIILDDTHPQIPLQLKRKIESKTEGKVYRAGISTRKSRFIPALPQRNPKTMPGCVVESVINASNQRHLINSQEEFDLMARALGFIPNLD